MDEIEPLDSDLPKPEQMEAHHYLNALWFYDLFIGYDHWPPYTFTVLASGPLVDDGPAP
jgi:hypothetical protein